MDDKKRHFSTLLSVMMIDKPLYALLIKRLKVVYVPEQNFIAGVNEREIRLGDSFFELDSEIQQGVIAHEALHVILSHPERGKKIIKHLKVSPNFHVILNVIADAKINHALTQDGFKLPSDAITLYGASEFLKVAEKELLEESLEELALKIWKKLPKVELDSYSCDVDFSEQGKEGQCESGKGGDGKLEDKGEQGKGKEGGQGQGEKEIVLNEGDKGVEKAKDDSELQDVKRQIFLESVYAAKAIGKVPAGLQRLVNELAKPKVNWKRIIRNAMEKGLGNDIRKTWSRLNRKNPMLPAKTQVGLRNVFCLVDTSGSIGQEQLRQMLSEIYAISKLRAKVIVIPWDAQAYEPIKMNKPSDIERVKVNLKGGGGTVIKPTIQKALQMSKRGDAFVILSDFYTGENDQELIALVNQLKRKGKVIAISVDGKDISFLPCITAKIKTL